ncbi:phosphopantetheine-binding protein [Dactylosporangium sp. AC04546]|uniref:acyl carrier protein n=1 Tax=unclassified Dactylosporangium TaxID=2621675 RepID=UPI001EDCCEEB|nr:phosphopantetheine-binding protein [Dactylosporangium sp. AC04546]WVK81313.1 phosphopantetheine-binding protein [Dactylosporangium sp. AC04546]
MQDVVAKVIDSAAVMVGRAPSSITAQSRFFEDLGFDSTTILELLMQLETDLDFDFDPDTLEADDFQSVETLARYVAARSRV